MARILILALGILLHVSPSAGAATNELKTELRAKKRLQITFLAQGTSNLYEANSRDHEANGRLTIAPGYKLGRDYRAVLSAGVLQEATQARETTMTNAKLSLTRSPLNLSRDTILIPSLGARLPTNVKDRKKNSYNGSLVLEPTLITEWAPGGFNFSTVYGLYLTKNLHTYDRNAAGGANLDYSVMNYFGVEKAILPKITLLIDGDYTYARTYQGSMRTQFSVGQSISYQATKEASFTIGHSNGGDALKANGTDYNIEVFDQNTSVIYANLRVVY